MATTRVPEPRWVLRRKVEIVWTDAASNAHAQHHEEAKERSGLLRCKVTGYLVKRTKEEIVVAQMQDEQGILSCTFSIPAGWVTSVKTVR